MINTLKREGIRLVAAITALLMGLAIVVATPHDEAEAVQQAWYCGPQSMPVYIYAPSLYGYRADNVLDQGSHSMTAIWNAIGHLNAQGSGASLYYAGTTTSLSRYNRIVLVFDTNAPGAAISDVYYSGQCSYGAKIRFNDNPTMSGYGYTDWRVNNYYENGRTTGWLDFQGVLTHELLHVYGQGHVWNGYATMYGSLNSWWRTTTRQRTVYTLFDVDYFNTLFN